MKEERDNISRKDLYKLKAAFALLAVINFAAVGLLIGIAYNQARECSKLRNEIETLKENLEFLNLGEHKKGIIFHNMSKLQHLFIHEF